MKRFYMLIVAILMCITLVACSSQSANDEAIHSNLETTTQIEVATEESDISNSLPVPSNMETADTNQQTNDEPVDSNAESTAQSEVATENTDQQASDEPVVPNTDSTTQSEVITENDNTIGSVSVSNETDVATPSTPLPLSDMVVEITSGENTATFQLYDTVAADEFYQQLPLTLELSNFRNAQWMFYPPEELNVTAEEAYHDGIKGELSYYAPWGDVFMLYEDFYAGDEMHRLGIGLTGIDQIADMTGSITITKYGEVATTTENSEEITEETLQIMVGAYDFTTTFADNSSAKALKELLADGDITIDMVDYGGFEKVGSLGTSLPTNNTSITTELGDIILYQGNQIVIYYDTNSWSFTRLGKIENTENLKEALGSGDVTVTLSLTKN
ncbi:cyclophilin-like fold protein [Chakrabartyella piscis]|uniref:cyclophilin-like fold protein n=1 Tax=Chakrabartyella piscis TaxID=2918914 RepID=UPI0029588808|nr:cyclophilin-like fold protein [Chakrabartyella piscis]